MSLTNNIKQYTDERKNELEIIQYINNVWSKGKWKLEQTSFNEDMQGVDAVGYEFNKTKADTKLLVQVKSESFMHLDEIRKIITLEKVAKAMNNIDPNASKRLIVYRKNGKSIRIFNYSIDKILKKKE